MRIHFPIRSALQDDREAETSFSIHSWIARADHDTRVQTEVGFKDLYNSPLLSLELAYILIANAAKPRQEPSGSIWGEICSRRLS
eukprot:767557-Hanusia_phi.AAC.3